MTSKRNLRFWPRNLYGQILLVAASALLVAQMINATLLIMGIRNRAASEAAAMVVSRVANQIERMEVEGNPTGQGDLWSLFGSPMKGGHRKRPPPVAIALHDKPVSIDRSEKQDELTERAQEFLSQGDIVLTDVNISTVSVHLLPAQLREPPLRRWQTSRFRSRDHQKPKTAILLSARLPDGTWINAAGLVRPFENASVIALLLQTLTLFVAVMIPLALVARRIANPLNQLTVSVQRFGLSDGMSPLPAAGPDDVRHLIEAFNAMQSRVSTLLGEKDVMLGAIGHDLKTPLAALRVRIESIEDEPERENMASIIDEMVTILDDILTLARLGKSGEAAQYVDVGALVESIAQEFSPVEYRVPDQRIIATIRPVLVRRALRNLIGNAIIYGKKARIEILEKAGLIEIIISDHGSGIEPSLIEAMFEPFTRAERSRSRSTGGSGLGLTISRAIARAHGGDVKLTNLAEGGLKAIFSVRI